MQMGEHENEPQPIDAARAMQLLDARRDGLIEEFRNVQDRRNECALRLVEIEMEMGAIDLAMDALRRVQ